MTKRHIEIDDDLLAKAQEITGEKTYKGTIEVALQGVIDREVAMRHVAWLKQKESLGLKALEEARRPRIQPNE